ncbi:hypothetical protein [Planococcus sp. SSTMD024]|uniref:hypothetical protein n=1 Tax=Planococcus sp. SSTMD024 TaxID=3242163 RepID=UPI00351E5BC8
MFYKQGRNAMADPAFQAVFHFNIQDPRFDLKIHRGIAEIDELGVGLFIGHAVDFSALFLSGS